MKISSVISLAIATFVVGAGTGYIRGYHSAQFDLALFENKIAAVNLNFDKNYHGSTNLYPQLREYLKARIYCNIYNYFPSKQGYLLQKDWDFGAVDRKLLGDVSVWKDPEAKVWDWSSAIKNK